MVKNPIFFEYMFVNSLNTNITTVSGKIPTKYAGSASAGGSANSAVKLDNSAGSAMQPVYFSGGKPVACTHTLGKSVPANAVFTDTDTKAIRVVQTLHFFDAGVNCYAYVGRNGCALAGAAVIGNNDRKIVSVSIELSSSAIGAYIIWCSGGGVVDLSVELIWLPL